MYKIRLACTGKNEFSYKTKIIDKKNIDDIVNNLNLRTYQYVEKGNFLYKTNNRFTCKFMEIICNDKITLTAFKNFIKNNSKCIYGCHLIINSLIRFVWKIKCIKIVI